MSIPDDDIQHDMEQDNSNSALHSDPPRSVSQQYNLRNPSVKRILAEARELHNSNEEFSAHPLEENIFEWHFTFRGPPDSDFEVGIYHGRIILPPDYPMKPPAFIMLTPNGRFEIGKKICLSISSHHPETWRPCWSIRTAVAALMAFMNSASPGAIGSLECSSEQRRAFARKSLAFECPQCGPCVDKITYTRQTKPQPKSTTEVNPPPKSARGVHQMPNSTPVIDDYVLRPEDIVGHPEHQVPVRPYVDELGDNHGGGAGRIIQWINVDQQGHDVYTTYGVSILAVAIGIIIIRRFVGNTDWGDIFGWNFD